MATHRWIRLTAVGLLVAVPLAAPAVANANPLLSGYGGPGAGNQAILGSALLNGPPSSGGGGTSGGGTSGGSGVPAPAGASAGAVPAAPAAGTAAATARAQRRARTGTGRGTSSQGTGSSGSSPPSLTGLQPARAVGALDIPASDILYILLACGVLALTGVLTARLMRPPRSEWRRS